MHEALTLGLVRTIGVYLRDARADPSLPFRPPPES